MVWQLQLQILITDDDGMTELQILIIDDGNWYDSNVVTFRAADFSHRWWYDSNVVTFRAADFNHRWWYDSNVVTFRAADFNQIDHILMIQKLQNLDFTQSSDWELKHTHIIQCFIFISHM